MNNGFTGTITSTATFNSDVQTREIDFIYDHNGMRTTKIVTENGRMEITEYTLHGKLITHLTKRIVEADNSETIQNLHFFYDAQSKPAFVEYNGTMYRYVHNIQGDIVGIVDNAGNLVVEYKYDINGKRTFVDGSMQSTLGMMNLFGFRGYAWDEDLGFYYLRSRYYNPIAGRFINADGIIINSVLGKNIFCYCWNNSTNHIDSSGAIVIPALLGKVIVGAVTGFAGSIISDLVTGNDVDWLGAVKAGTIDAIASLFPVKIMSGLASIALNTVDYLWECDVENKDVEAEVIVWEVASTVAGEVLGAGFEHGAEVAHKTVDKVVQEVYETGIGVSTDAVGKKVKTEAESRTAQSKAATAQSKATSSSSWNMPYLKMVYDPLLGRKREVICY